VSEDPLDGTPADGTPADGTPADGTPVDGMPVDETTVGTVIRLHARQSIVRTAVEELRCVVRGRLFGASRRATRPVAVGDRVEVRGIGEGEGAIERVLPRRTKLSRPGVEREDREQVIAANVDLAVIVASASLPPYRPGLVDRILIAAHSGGLDRIVCVNKCDEGDPAEIEEPLAAAREAGVDVVLTSAVTGSGIEELRERMRGRVSVFSGQSGVGKSSLINAVQPGLKLRVGEIGEKTGKGRHTTTDVSLLTLEFGGFVVDTPGVREFGLWDVARADLDRFFPEIASRAGACRYPDCSHTHEPDCAVKEAVESGRIRPIRYESYSRILETLDD